LEDTDNVGKMTSEMKHAAMAYLKLMMMMMIMMTIFRIIM
jgi:hypothetical protein